MSRRKRWWLILGLVLAAGLSYLAYSLIAHTKTDSLTVTELKTQAGSLHGKSVQVEGKVAPGSIDWDSGSRTTKFVLTDDRESLAVVFKGIPPDNFKPGTNLIVEGKHRSDDVFEAASFSSRRSLCNLCHSN